MFNTWIDTFVEEKGLDLDHTFEVEGASGTNWISVAVVVEFFKSLPATVQNQVKTKIVEVDYHNGDMMHFFKFAAKGMAQ